MKQHQSIRTNKIYLLSGLAVFISALAYYVLFRAQLPWPGYLLNLEAAPLAQFSDLSKGAYPSFAFSLAMGLIAMALFHLNKMRTSVAVVGIWFVGVMHEVSLSTFSQLDIAANTVGALVVLALVHRCKQPTDQLDQELRPVIERLKMCALMLVSATLATGTSAYEPIDNSYCEQYDNAGTCVSRYSDAEPIYMSYTELRSAVKMSEPRELTSVSRIVLYDNMLFINDKNQGIHIVNNVDPKNPESIGFIEIPGNTEVSIRDNNLYADSYIDLVTLDLSDMNNVVEIARQPNIFPYNARQNIPDNIYLYGVIDSDFGVVVGYR